MRLDKAWAHRTERARLYAASLTVRLGVSILRAARRLYRAGFLHLAGIEYAVGVSAKLRHMGWRLVRWKDRSRHNTPKRRSNR